MESKRNIHYNLVIFHPIVSAVFFYCIWQMAGYRGSYQIATSASTMTGRPRKLCPHFFLVTASALLTPVVISPATARASCGDYVTVVGADGAPMRHTHEAAVRGGGLEQRRASSERPVPCSRCPASPSRPCQGPWCSSTHLPLAPAAPAFQHSVDAWTCWAICFVPEVTVRPLALDTPLAGIDCVDAVFHPPRCL